MRRISILLLFFVSLSFSSTKIDKAREFISEACVSKGSKLEFVVGGNADFKIKNWNKSGIVGEVKFKKSEIEGLTDNLNQYSSKQATEIRECMKPYIDKILDYILKENKFSYYLKNLQYGSVNIYKYENYLKNPKEYCSVEANTPAEKLKDKLFMGTTLVYVRVLDGKCKDYLGWTGIETLQRSN